MHITPIVAKILGFKPYDIGLSHKCSQPWWHLFCVAYILKYIELSILLPHTSCHSNILIFYFKMYAHDGLFFPPVVSYPNFRTTYVAIVHSGCIYRMLVWIIHETVCRQWFVRAWVVWAVSWVDISDSRLYRWRPPEVTRESQSMLRSWRRRTCLRLSDKRCSY